MSRHLSSQSEQTDKTASSTDRIPPGRIGAVVVKVVSSNQIDLKWTGVKDSDFNHYNIYMGTKSSFKVIPGVTVPTGTSTTNSYSRTVLNPSTKYYYKIAVVDDSGNIGTLSSARYGITNARSLYPKRRSVCEGDCLYPKRRSVCEGDCLYPKRQSTAKGKWSYS